MMRDRLVKFHETNVLIRAMEPEDYSAVYTLWDQTEGITLTASDDEDAIIRYLNRNPGLSFVASSQNKDEIIAAVLCGHDGARGCIRHLAVKPLFRKRGLGQYLVSCCMNELQKASIHKCTIYVNADNPKGLEFWLRDKWTLRTDLNTLSKVIR